MVFLDASVPMYLIGAPHPNQLIAAGLIQRIILDGARVVTDAEVFQEILHRCSAIRRTEAIQPAFDTLFGLVEEVFPIDLEAAQDARSIVLGYPGISSRDALHVAVMKRHGVSQILSFDEDYDRIPGIERLSRL